MIYINPASHSPLVQYLEASHYGLLIEQPETHQEHQEDLSGQEERFQDFFRYDYEEAMQLNQTIAKIKKLEQGNGKTSDHD